MNQNLNEKSSINPSGFVGIISQNSNITVDRSYIEKGNAFVNAFEHSNISIKNCGTPEPYEISTEELNDALTTKLKYECDSKNLPPWVHYKFIKLSLSDDHEDSLSLTSKSGENSIIQVGRLKSSDIDETFNTYRNNLLSAAGSKGEADEKYSIERQALADDVSTSNIKATSLSLNVLSGVESSIKAVWPLDSYHYLSADIPNISLHFNKREVFPLSINTIENKEINEGQPIKIKNVSKQDKFGNYFISNQTDNISDITHKYIASSVLNVPRYTSEYYSLYSDGAFKLPLSSFENSNYTEGSDLPSTLYYIMEPYLNSRNNICYYTNSKTSSKKILQNDELGKENTFYFKFNNKIYSLFDYINGNLSESLVSSLNSTYDIPDIEDGYLSLSSNTLEEFSDYQPDDYYELSTWVLGFANKNKSMEDYKEFYNADNIGTPITDDLKEINGTDIGEIIDELPCYKNRNNYLSINKNKIPSSYLYIEKGKYYDLQLGDDQSYDMNKLLNEMISNGDQVFIDDSYSIEGTAKNSVVASSYVIPSCTSSVTLSEDEIFGVLSSELYVDELNIDYSKHKNNYTSEFSYPISAFEYSITEYVLSSLEERKIAEHLTSIDHRVNVDYIYPESKDDADSEFWAIHYNMISSGVYLGEIPIGGATSLFKYVSYYKKNIISNVIPISSALNTSISLVLSSSAIDLTNIENIQIDENKNISSMTISNTLSSDLSGKLLNKVSFENIESEIKNNIILPSSTWVSEDTYDFINHCENNDVLYNITRRSQLLLCNFSDIHCFCVPLSKILEDNEYSSINADTKFVDFSGLDNDEYIIGTNYGPGGKQSYENYPYAYKCSTSIANEDDFADIYRTPLENYLTGTLGINTDDLSSYIYGVYVLSSNVTIGLDDLDYQPGYKVLDISVSGITITPELTPNFFFGNGENNNDYDTSRKKSVTVKVKTDNKNKLIYDLSTYIKDEKIKDVSNCILSTDVEVSSGKNTSISKNIEYSDSDLSKNGLKGYCRTNSKTNVEKNEFNNLSSLLSNVSSQSSLQEINDFINSQIENAYYDIDTQSISSIFDDSYLSSILKSQTISFNVGTETNEISAYIKDTLDDQISSNFECNLTIEGTNADDNNSINVYYEKRTNISYKAAEDYYIVSFEGELNTTGKINEDGTYDIVEGDCTTYDLSKLYDYENLTYINDNLFRIENRLYLNSNNIVVANIDEEEIKIKYKGTLLTNEILNDYNLYYKTTNSLLYLNIDIASVSNFLTLYYDSECTIPLEYDDNSTEKYLYTHSSNGRKIYSSNQITTGAYKNRYTYKYLRKFAYETTNIYEEAEFNDWYNINTYINYNKFNDSIVSDDTFSIKSNNDLEYYEDYAVIPKNTSILLSSNSTNENVNFNSLITSGSNGDFKYKALSFNFMIPSAGWIKLNDEMYKKNENAGNVYSEGSVNDVGQLSAGNTYYPSIENLSGAVDDCESFNMYLLMRYHKLTKSGTNLHGIDRYESEVHKFGTTIKIRPSDVYLSGYNSKLITVTSITNDSLKFADYLLSGQGDTEYSCIHTINNLSFDTYINDVKTRIQIPVINLSIRYNDSTKKLTASFVSEKDFNYSYSKDYTNVSSYVDEINYNITKNNYPSFKMLNDFNVLPSNYKEDIDLYADNINDINELLNQIHDASIYGNRDSFDAAANKLLENYNISANILLSSELLSSEISGYIDTPNENTLTSILVSSDINDYYYYNNVNEAISTLKYKLKHMNKSDSKSLVGMSISDLLDSAFSFSYSYTTKTFTIKLEKEKSYSRLRWWWRK